MAVDSKELRNASWSCRQSWTVASRCCVVGLPWHGQAMPQECQGESCGAQPLYRSRCVTGYLERRQSRLYPVVPMVTCHELVNCTVVAFDAYQLDRVTVSVNIFGTRTSMIQEMHAAKKRALHPSGSVHFGVVSTCQNRNSPCPLRAMIAPVIIGQMAKRGR